VVEDQPAKKVKFVLDQTETITRQDGEIKALGKSLEAATAAFFFFSRGNL